MESKKVKLVKQRLNGDYQELEGGGKWETVFEAPNLELTEK